MSEILWKLRNSVEENFRIKLILILFVFVSICILSISTIFFNVIVVVIALNVRLSDFTWQFSQNFTWFSAETLIKSANLLLHLEANEMSKLFDLIVPLKIMISIHPDVLEYSSFPLKLQLSVGLIWLLHRFLLFRNLRCTSQISNLEAIIVRDIRQMNHITSKVNK